MWLIIGKWLGHRKWTVLLVSIILIASLASIATLAWRLHAARSSVSQLQDQLMSAEVVRQIGDTQAEVLTAEVADLKARLEKVNADLVDQLARGEKVVSLTQTRIVYRTAAVDIPGNVSTVPATATAPAQARVDFVGEKGPVHVAGYTLAPAGTAHLEWAVAPLQLDVVVTRGKDGRYRTLFDTHDEAWTVTAASTAIDPSVLLDTQRRWYIAATAMVGVPDWRTVAVGVDGGYQWDRVSAGLAYLHDGYGLEAGHRLGLRVGGRF